MTVHDTSARSGRRIGGLVSMLFGVLGLVLLARAVQPTWAQPHQTGLHQSLPTGALTATAGPTATRTATPAAGVVRKLLQQGRDGYAGTSDAWISSYKPTQHVTDHACLWLKGPDAWSPLIRFDLTNQIPPDATVVAAELVFFVESNDRLRTLEVGAFRLRRAWDPASVTWNSATSSEQWGLPGANHVSLDRLGEADDRRTFIYRGVFYGFDVTDSVQYWLEHPAENYGWVIKGVSNSTGEFCLRSSLDSTPLEQRPILRIDYRLTTPPTGTPTPTATITPTPSDQNLRALVFHDLDGDGFQDAGESGLPGVLVELTTLTSLSVQHGLTGVDGSYSFGQPPAQEYRLRVHVPWGYYPTTLTSERIAYSGAHWTVSFGMRSGSSLALPMIKR